MLASGVRIELPVLRVGELEDLRADRQRLLADVLHLQDHRDEHPIGRLAEVGVEDVVLDHLVVDDAVADRPRAIADDERFADRVGARLLLVRRRLLGGCASSSGGVSLPAQPASAVTAAVLMATVKVRLSIHP
jgi:hypothetical protein